MKKYFLLTIVYFENMNLRDLNLNFECLNKNKNDNLPVK